MKKTRFNRCAKPVSRRAFLLGAGGCAMGLMSRGAISRIRGGVVTVADPYATRGPQAGDVWLNWGAATDGSGSDTNPWNTFTAARLLALAAGQGLWIQGTGPWPVTTSIGISGTSNNRTLLKQWPSGAQGGFTFTGAGQQSGGASYWDMVGLTLSCPRTGLCMGEDDQFSGGPGLSTYWRFIDCIGTRSGTAYTDNQGIIWCTSGSSIGHEIIRGSYTGPSGESNNQSNLWFDNLSTSSYTSVLILGVLVDQAANPIYFKHTSNNSLATAGGTVQNCIIRRGGRGFQAALNYVNYINNVFDTCNLGLDESGGAIAGGNNCNITNNTFYNSNCTADITDSGTHEHLNNTLTSNIFAGASQWEDDPSGAVDQGNVIDYSAVSTGSQHYQRNHTGYNTAAAYNAAYATQEVHGLTGTVQFVGGASGGGATAAGWALVASSFGTAANGQAGSNGADRGVNAANLLTTN